MKDPLTQLPNRRAFQRELSNVLAQRKGSANPLAVLLLDLDRFKHINNVFGHVAGDQVLEVVTKRVKEVLLPADMMARVGDDEFAILLPNVFSAGNAVLAAIKIEKAMHNPLTIDGHRIHLGVSTGIAAYPEHGQSAEVLMRRAGLALDDAKKSQQSYAVFSVENEADSLVGLKLEQQLRGAIERDELTMYFQPQIDIKTGQVIGMEALARWICADCGFVPPDQFIPLAERTGLIQALTLQTLKKALHQADRWIKQGYEFSVSVNLSACTLQDPEMPELIHQALQVWGVPPERLVLEITETALMEDPACSLDVLKRLSKIGITLSIDDFGTGYSSLSYLKKLPVDELKIDKSFVMNMANDKDDVLIVRSIVQLGQVFGLRLVAEGIEDQRSWDMLEALDCDVAQGYFIAQPMAPQEVDKWLRERAAVPPIDR